MTRDRLKEEARAARLKAALRDNLRKRKAQGRDDGPAPTVEPGRED